MQDYVNDIPVSDAAENDWLEITYAKRKFFSAKKAEKPKKKVFVTAIVALVMVAALVGLFFLGGANGDFWQTAKSVYTSGWFQVKNEPNYDTIALPAWWQIDEIDNGVVTFSGGKLALSLENGKVKEVSESSVTVVSANGEIVFNGLAEVLVKAGDDVEKYAVLGVFSDKATFTIVRNGEIVTDVVGNGSSVKWAV